MNEPTTSIVIFGASGDLTNRKLIPALYHLYRKKRLPASTQIIGFARRPWDHTQFRSMLREKMQDYHAEDLDLATWQTFEKSIYYVEGNLNDPDAYQKLEKFLTSSEAADSHRLYYLATAPSFYQPVVEHLGQFGMTGETKGWRRIIVEKPFGTDLESAKDLNHFMHQYFQEHQIYRIDHYLGKETAQNLLFFRFANTIFEPIWNRNYIDHVQISVTEKVDVGHRAGYYDQAGVLRDMFQNHILQLLSLTAMEPPASMEADAIRNEKMKVFAAIRKIPEDMIANETLRAQYAGYLDAEGVAPNSETPTFAIIRLFIDNWRWQGVPFYLRSGKALKEKKSEIIIQFRCPPHVMFPLECGKSMSPNLLAFAIQPGEGMHIRFEVKVPDTLSETSSVNMNFHYDDAFNTRVIPDAYERLLLDAVNGDATLYTRSDGIEKSWEIVDQVIHGWRGEHAPKLEHYTPGSWGPRAADVFMRRDRRIWHESCMARR